MRGLRFARGVAKILLFVSLAVPVAIVIYLQTPGGRRSARDLIQSQASRLLQGELRVGRVDGALFTGVELSDLVLTADGLQVVRIRSAHVRYSLLQILRGESIIIDEISLRDVVLDVRRTSSGALNLSQLLKPRAPSSDGPGRSIDIRKLGIENGTITFAGAWGPSWLTLPQSITGLTTTFGVRVAGGNVTLPISSFTARGSNPELIVRRFAGTIAFTRTGGPWTTRLSALIGPTCDSASTWSAPAASRNTRLALIGRPFTSPSSRRLPPASGRSTGPRSSL